MWRSCALFAAPSILLLDEATSSLDSEHDECIRAGHHCAQPLSAAGARERHGAGASFYVYNDETDADAPADGVAEAVRLLSAG